MEIVSAQTYNSHRIATVLHDANSKNIVIFCHGYRGTSVGPSRFFVKTARMLADQGISSLRFDQYGSGNSGGGFYESSFTDWVKTTKAIVWNYLEQGYAVALFGQSMGGAAAIAVASEVTELAAVIAWVPDPNVEPFEQPKEGYVEEGGQRVQALYWQEAHDAAIAHKLTLTKPPTYIVQCTADEYVDQQNRDALSRAAQPHHKIETFEGYAHSSWTYKQAEEIITKSVSFLTEAFRKVPGHTDSL